MAGIGAFVAPFAILYGVLSREESGSILLLGVPLSMLLLGVYLLRVTRRAPDLPEDRPDGIAPELDEVGEFPSASVWPFVVGLGATLAAYGFAFNPWLALPGAGVLGLGLSGMVAESTGSS
jgi:hypothetical protein